MRTLSAMTLAELKQQRNLTFDDLAAHLGCSKGHAADLCTGRRPVTARIARRLEAFTGRPWHEWMSRPAEAAS